MEQKKTEDKPRKRVVVEEIASISPASEATLQIDQMAAPASRPSGRKLGSLWFIIPILLILGTLGGGIYVFTREVSENEVEATPTPTFEPLPSPTPTPAPAKIDLSKYTIAIQNGSGIAGEGAKARDNLSQAGFKVASVGNASSYGFTKTQISAKKDLPPDFLGQLIGTLEKSYLLDKIKEATSSQKTDVVIIVGKTKAP